MSVFSVFTCYFMLSVGWYSVLIVDIGSTNIFIPKITLYFIVIVCNFTVSVFANIGQDFKTILVGPISNICHIFLCRSLAMNILNINITNSLQIGKLS